MTSAFRAHAPGPMVLLVLAALLVCAGCGGDNAALGPESDEPLYRDGQQKKREGQVQEALADFLRVIAKRADQAPESHLEVGLIQQEYDPVAAIYHFNKYIELEPNSRQVPNVRDLINTAKRNFARTLPLATPAMEGAAGQSELLEQINRLQRKNDDLEAQLVSQRGEISLFPGSHPAADPGGAPSAAFVAPVPVPAESSPVAAPVASAPPAPEAPPPAARPRPAPAAPPRNATGRSYTVQPRDNLFGIVKKVYGTTATKARIQAILDANRDVLSSAGALRPGMELKMPP